MSETSLRDNFEHFRRIRREIIADATAHQQKEAVALAIGILMGGGFPGCAATVAVLAERAFPGTVWAWVDE
jgi:hypothetical protein